MYFGRFLPSGRQGNTLSATCLPAGRYLFIITCRGLKPTVSDNKKDAASIVNAKNSLQTTNYLTKF